MEELRAQKAGFVTLLEKCANIISKSPSFKAILKELQERRENSPAKRTITKRSTAIAYVEPIKPRRFQRTTSARTLTKEDQAAFQIEDGCNQLIMRKQTRQRTLRLDDMGIFEHLPEDNKIYRVHQSLSKDPFNEDFTVKINKREVKDQDNVTQNVQIIEIMPNSIDRLPQINTRAPKPSRELLKHLGLSPRVQLRKNNKFRRKHLKKVISRSKQASPLTSPSSSKFKSAKKLAASSKLGSPRHIRFCSSQNSCFSSSESKLKLAEDSKIRQSINLEVVG